MLRSPTDLSTCDMEKSYNPFSSTPDPTGLHDGHVSLPTPGSDSATGGPRQARQRRLSGSRQQAAPLHSNPISHFPPSTPTPRYSNLKPTSAPPGMPRSSQYSTTAEYPASTSSSNAPSFRRRASVDWADFFKLGATDASSNPNNSHICTISQPGASPPTILSYLDSSGGSVARTPIESNTPPLPSYSPQLTLATRSTAQIRSSTSNHLQPSELPSFPLSIRVCPDFATVEPIGPSPTASQFSPATTLFSFSQTASPLLPSIDLIPVSLKRPRMTPESSDPSTSESKVYVSGSQPGSPVVNMKTKGKRSKPDPMTKSPAVRAKPKRPEGYTPRPPNAWILYRSAQIRILKEDTDACKKPQSDISKLIGHMWKDETPAVRRWYDEQAELKKLEHAGMYPDYKFCPVRRGKPIMRASGSDKSSASSPRAALPRRKRASTVSALEDFVFQPPKESLSDVRPTVHCTSASPPNYSRDVDNHHHFTPSYSTVEYNNATNYRGTLSVDPTDSSGYLSPVDSYAPSMNPLWMDAPAFSQPMESKSSEAINSWRNLFDPLSTNLTWFTPQSAHEATYPPISAPPLHLSPLSAPAAIAEFRTIPVTSNPNLLSRSSPSFGTSSTFDCGVPFGAVDPQLEGDLAWSRQPLEETYLDLLVPYSFVDQHMLASEKSSFAPTSEKDRTLSLYMKDYHIASNGDNDLHFEAPLTSVGQSDYSFPARR